MDDMSDSELIGRELRRMVKQLENTLTDKVQGNIYGLRVCVNDDRGVVTVTYRVRQVL